MAVKPPCCRLNRLKTTASWLFFCGHKQDSKIPSNYEHKDDFPNGSTPEPGKAFGAYVTANLNDSNFDGKIDYKQHNVDSDPDLIEINIKFPAHYNPEFDTWKMRLLVSKSRKIQLYKDKSKKTHWEGFENTTPGETEKIYAEVNKVSKSIGDYWIRVEHTWKNDTGVVIQEYDRIQLTSIWVDDAQPFDRNRVHEVADVDKSSMTVKIGSGTMIPPGMPGQGDLVMIYDDDNEYILQGGAPRKGSDQARNKSTGAAAIFRVKSISGTSLTLEKAGDASDLPSAFPSWLSKGDVFQFIAPKQIDESAMLSQMQHAGFFNGNQRNTPISRWGIIIRFEAKPEGITTTKLADSKKVYFDITRQIRANLSGVEKSGDKDFSKWPSGDTPNDDPAGIAFEPREIDQDVVTVGGSESHDFLFVWDSPGPPNRFYMGFDFERWVGRFNAKEFVRLQFVTKTPDWKPHTQAGTRCSIKTKWCTALNVLADLSKQVRLDGKEKYKFKKRTRFDGHKTNDQRGKLLPTLMTTSRANTGLIQYWPDNDVYFGFNWHESVIKEVEDYNFTRPEKKK